MIHASAGTTSGLTAGASYKDSGADTSTDTTAFGLTYAMEASGAGITLAYTTATTEAATQDSDATNKHGKEKLASLDKAKSYVKSGGKIDAIKRKYQLTPDQEKALTTL